MEIFIGIIGIILVICWFITSFFIFEKVLQYILSIIFGRDGKRFREIPLYLDSYHGVSYEKMILFFIFNAIAQVGGPFLISLQNSKICGRLFYGIYYLTRLQ